MLPDVKGLAAIFGNRLGLDLRFDLARGEACEERANVGRAALAALRTEVEGRTDVDDLEFPNPRYSLTHSADVALAVVDASACLDGIGIDLEVERSLRPQAARFFLTEKEQRWLQTLEDEHRSKHLLRLWCTKEAVFKANPENRTTLLGDHEIVEPADVSGEARTREGRLLEYASWCEPRTCVAIAVCRRG